jgi:hypothetical protein
MRNFTIFHSFEKANDQYLQFLKCGLFPLNEMKISHLPAEGNIFICDYLHIFEAPLLKSFIDEETNNSFILGLIDPSPGTQVDWVDAGCYPVCELNKKCSLQDIEIILNTRFTNIEYSSINEFCESAFFFPCDMSWRCQVSTRFEAAIFWFYNEKLLHSFVDRHKYIVPFATDSLRKRGIGFASRRGQI